MSNPHKILLFSVTLIAALLSNRAALIAGPADSHASQGIGIEMTQAPKIPESLLKAGVTSALATLVVSVDENGALDDWLLVEASDQSLEKAIAEVIETWTFRPALQDGQAIAARQTFPLQFEAAAPTQRFSRLTNSDTLAYRYFDPADRSEIKHKYTQRIQLVDPPDLDQLPTLIEYVKPSVAPEVYAANKGASLRFTFYLDGEGRVRMPSLSHIDGPASPAAIFAAQTALEQWKFEPVTQGGKPVLTLLAQTIHFSHLYD